MFERLPHWLSRALDRLAARLWPDSPASLEFRGGDIYGGKKHWRGLGKIPRRAALAEALQILASNQRVRLFGAVIDKSAVSPDDPMECAFEHVANRFDRYLGRLHKRGDTQRGLIVLDKSIYETSIQGLAREHLGHRWGHLHNLSEVPLFVDSRATRMVQFADMVAYAIRRAYDGRDTTFFDVIKASFDADGGVIHGLVHTTSAAATCDCIVCAQRRKRQLPFLAASSTSPSCAPP